MIIPTIVPVPVQTAKNCIIKDGQKYCESINSSAKVIGGVTLFFVCVTWYVIHSFDLVYDNKITHKQLGLRLVSPVVIIAVILIVFG